MALILILSLFLSVVTATQHSEYDDQCTANGQIEFTGFRQHFHNAVYYRDDSYAVDGKYTYWTHSSPQNTLILYFCAIKQTWYVTSNLKDTTDRTNGCLGQIFSTVLSGVWHELDVSGKWIVSASAKISCPNGSTGAHKVNCVAWDDKNCTDRNCMWWASIGECTSNRSYMISMCPTACQSNAKGGLEKRHTANCQAWTDPGCTDEQCAKWEAAGQCTSNADYMLPMCPINCIPDGAGTTATGTPPVSTKAPQSPNKACKDVNKRFKGSSQSQRLALLNACNSLPSCQPKTSRKHKTKCMAAKSKSGCKSNKTEAACVQAGCRAKKKRGNFKKCK